MAGHSPRTRSRRDFRLLWAGQTISELGSQVSVLALPLLAIDTLHASALQVGVLTAMETVPFVLVGLPAGAWIDRLRRRPVLIAADVGRALVLASVPAAWALSVLTLAQLYLVAVLAGVLTVFFDVAYQSYLPALVPADELIASNGKLAATESGAYVAGPALGGALVSLLGAATAVLADAVSFVISTASLLAIRADEAKPTRAVDAAGEQRRLHHEIAEGMRFVWREPRIRSVAFTTATANFFNSMGLAVMLLYLRHDVHLSPGRIGLLFGLGSIGGIVGGAIAGRVSGRLGVGPAIMWSSLAGGLAEARVPLATPSNATAVLLVGGLISSTAVVIYNVTQVSLRQALCPPRLLGRMNASVRFLIWGTMPLGALVGGALGGLIGLRPTLWIGAGGSVLAFSWVAFSPVRSLRTMPRPSEPTPTP